MRFVFLCVSDDRVGPQGTPPLQRCRVPRPLTRSGEATRLQTAVASEFFVDPTGDVVP